jgi:hypothetical protein
MYLFAILCVVSLLTQVPIERIPFPKKSYLIAKNAFQTFLLDINVGNVQRLGGLVIFQASAHPKVRLFLQMVGSRQRTL